MSRRSMGLSNVETHRQSTGAPALHLPGETKMLKANGDFTGRGCRELWIEPVRPRSLGKQIARGKTKIASKGFGFATTECPQIPGSRRLEGGGETRPFSRFWRRAGAQLTLAT